MSIAVADATSAWSDLPPDLDSAREEIQELRGKLLKASIEIRDIHRDRMTARADLFRLRKHYEPAVYGNTQRQPTEYKAEEWMWREVG